MHAALSLKATAVEVERPGDLEEDRSVWFVRRRCRHSFGGGSCVRRERTK